MPGPRKPQPPKPLDAQASWAGAVAKLRRLDRKLAALVKKHGPCTLTPRPDRFGTLVRAIIGQQISAKAAAAIDRKLREVAGAPHDPENLIALGASGLRSAGLSSVKAQYVLNLAEAVLSGAVPVDQFDREDDALIVEQLTSVKGIGVWTAEMFLIFALNRPDVLPVLDLSVRIGMQRHFELETTPKPKECLALGEIWRPYRTIAIWYIWEDYDGGTPKPA